MPKPFSRDKRTRHGSITRMSTWRADMGAARVRGAGMTRGRFSSESRGGLEQLRGEYAAPDLFCVLIASRWMVGNIQPALNDVCYPYAVDLNARTEQGFGK